MTSREVLEKALKALNSIYEVDDNGWGDGTATVNINMPLVEEAIDGLERVLRLPLEGDKE